MAKPIAQLRQETRTPIDGGTGGSGGSKEPTGIPTFTSFAEKSESSQPQTESQPGMFGNIPLNNAQPSGADATNGDATPPTGTSGTPGTSADTINGADATNGTSADTINGADATNGTPMPPVNDTNPDTAPPSLRTLSFISKASKIDKNSQPISGNPEENGSDPAEVGEQPDKSIKSEEEINLDKPLGTKESKPNDTNLEAGKADTADKNSDKASNPETEPENPPKSNSDITNDAPTTPGAKKDDPSANVGKHSSTALTGCERMEKLFNDKLAAVKSKYKLTDDSYSPASKDSATKPIDPSSKSECFKINTGKIEHFGEKILDDDCQAAAYMYAAFVHLFPPKSLDTFSFYTDQDLTLFEPGNSKFFQALDEKQSGISLKQVCPNKFQNIKERYEYVNDANEKTSKDTATKIINSKSKSECFEMDQGKIIAFGENVLHSSCHEISYFYAANIYFSEDTKDLSAFMVDSALDLTPYEIENTEFINSLNL